MSCVKRFFMKKVARLQSSETILVSDPSNAQPPTQICTSAADGEDNDSICSDGNVSTVSKAEKKARAISPTAAVQTEAESREGVRALSKAEAGSGSAAGSGTSPRLAEATVKSPGSKKFGDTAAVSSGVPSFAGVTQTSVPAIGVSCTAAARTLPTVSVPVFFSEVSQRKDSVGVAKIPESVRGSLTKDPAGVLKVFSLSVEAEANPDSFTDIRRSVRASQEPTTSGAYSASSRTSEEDNCPFICSETKATAYNTRGERTTFTPVSPSSASTKQQTPTLVLAPGQKLPEKYLENLVSVPETRTLIISCGFYARHSPKPAPLVRNVYTGTGLTVERTIWNAPPECGSSATEVSPDADSISALASQPAQDGGDQHNASAPRATDSASAAAAVAHLEPESGPNAARVAGVVSEVGAQPQTALSWLAESEEDTSAFAEECATPQALPVESSPSAVVSHSPVQTSEVSDCRGESSHAVSSQDISRSHNTTGQSGSYTSSRCISAANPTGTTAERHAGYNEILPCAGPLTNIAPLGGSTTHISDLSPFRSDKNTKSSPESLSGNTPAVHKIHLGIRTTAANAHATFTEDGSTEEHVTSAAPLSDTLNAASVAHDSQEASKETENQLHASIPAISIKQDENLTEYIEETSINGDTSKSSKVSVSNCLRTYKTGGDVVETLEARSPTTCRVNPLPESSNACGGDSTEKLLPYLETTFPVYAESEATAVTTSCTYRFVLGSGPIPKEPQRITVYACTTSTEVEANQPAQNTSETPLPQNPDLPGCGKSVLNRGSSSNQHYQGICSESPIAKREEEPSSSDATRNRHISSPEPVKETEAGAMEHPNNHNAFAGRENAPPTDGRCVSDSVDPNSADSSESTNTSTQGNTDSSSLGSSRTSSRVPFYLATATWQNSTGLPLIHTSNPGTHSSPLTNHSSADLEDGLNNISEDALSMGEDLGEPGSYFLSHGPIIPLAAEAVDSNDLLDVPLPFEIPTLEERLTEAEGGCVQIHSYHQARHPLQSVMSHLDGRAYDTSFLDHPQLLSDLGLLGTTPPELEDTVGTPRQASSTPGLSSALPDVVLLERVNAIKRGEGTSEPTKNTKVKYAKTANLLYGKAASCSKNLVQPMVKAGMVDFPNEEAGDDEEEEEDEEEAVFPTAHLMDVFQLTDAFNENRELLNSAHKKYSRQLKKTAAVQQYVVQQTRELGELSRLTKMAEHQAAAMREERKDLDVELQRKCDLMSVDDESTARKHEPLIYKKFLAAKTAPEAKALLATIRSRQRALHFLEALTYRKCVSLQHNFKLEENKSVEKEQKPSNKKLLNLGGPPTKKPRKNKDLATALCTPMSTPSSLIPLMLSVGSSSVGSVSAGALALTTPLATEQQQQRQQQVPNNLQLQQLTLPPHSLLSQALQLQSISVLSNSVTGTLSFDELSETQV